MTAARAPPRRRAAAADDDYLSMLGIHSESAGM